MCPAHQLDILDQMGANVGHEPAPADLILDAMLGYSLRGDPRGRAAELIGWANGSGTPVLSLDCPSGLDVTTGDAADPCVRAAATLTLALPKIGLLKSPEVGDLFLADISVPPSVYAALGLAVSPQLFKAGRVVAVGRGARERA